MAPNFLKAAGTAAAVASAVTAVYLVESIRTGEPLLDRLELRGRLVLEALRRFGFRAVADKRLLRALVAIVHNESRGNPANNLGDKTASGGPSVGIMQVYRTTAEDMKLWTRPAWFTLEQAKSAYAAEATKEGQGIAWGVAVFAEKLRIAKGDIPEAVRRYNGSGEAAEAYKARALAFAASKGWSLS